MDKAKDLKVVVHSIKGKCPIYSEGDTFYIADGFKLRSNTNLCMHALSALMPYYVALSHDVPPKDIGLGKDTAYVQCSDPCEYTHGGTVVFRVYTITK